MSSRDKSAFIRAIANDNSLPIEKAAVDLWVKDLDNPFRWTLRPILQFLFAILLHLTWFFKRLPLPQFSGHGILQKLICWFCKNLVSPEANFLILRHFWTESNLLNFLAENTGKDVVVDLYPKRVDDMLRDSFIKHDQELFEAFFKCGDANDAKKVKPEQLKWNNWKKLQADSFEFTRKKTQVIDFETAHALFMCLFCFLLKRDEYRDAINGFNLDQSIAIRIGRIIDKPEVVEMAYNKFPHYLVGPWNLSQRFLMHGFFTEYLYAELEAKRNDVEQSSNED